MKLQSNGYPLVPILNFLLQQFSFGLFQKINRITFYWAFYTCKPLQQNAVFPQSCFQSWSHTHGVGIFPRDSTPSAQERTAGEHPAQGESSHGRGRRQRAFWGNNKILQLPSHPPRCEVTLPTFSPGKPLGFPECWGSITIFFFPKCNI